MKRNIAIFATGTGSNAGKLMEHMAERSDISVALVLSNKENAPVLDLARSFDVPVKYVSRADFNVPEKMVQLMQSLEIDLSVLAGFLLKLPDDLVKAFPQKIVNIHPSLLPKFGGKGMYGMNVHQAVVDAGETESGITIHFVNEVYDDGEIIFQAQIALLPEDTPSEVQKKVLKLEHLHFPRVVEEVLSKS